MNSIQYLQTTLCLLLTLLPTTRLAAEPLRLADVFGDHMVLQREMPVRVWGWAEPGATVQVSFSNQMMSTRADAEGFWGLELPAMPGNAKGRILEVRSGSEQLKLTDVKVGEVWLAAGQSNMVQAEPDLDSGIYPFYQTPGDPAALPEIRIRYAAGGASLTPLADTDPLFRGIRKWGKLEEPLRGNHAIYSYFARILRDELQVPVGILHVAVSGTGQTAWMARETLESFPGVGGHANYFEESFASMQRVLKQKSRSEIKSWEDFEVADRAWRADPPAKGNWPGQEHLLMNFPSALYNTRVHPLAPMAIRGVIWHQGEAGPGGNYGPRMAAQFSQWRKLFRRDFPVIVGTLTRGTGNLSPPLIPEVKFFYRSITNLEIRRAPDLNQDEAPLEYVEFFDLGNHDTHFGMKNEAGRRMALAALDRVYGKPSVYAGPRLASAEIEGDKIRVVFERTGEGLLYKPSFEGISGFFLRGASGKEVWAEVTPVDEKTLMISHPDIPSPKLLAYGLHPNPHETLFNRNGFPASPFIYSPERVRADRKQNIGMVNFGEDPEGAVLHLAHLRRHGYVFQVLKHRLKAPTDVLVSAIVSTEWPEVEVLHNGKRVPFERFEDQNGRSRIRFRVAVNGPPAVIAEAGKGKSLEQVNRF